MKRRRKMSALQRKFFGKKRRVRSMARRRVRHSFARRSSGRGMLGKVQTGFVSGMPLKLIAGAGAASVSDKLPQMLPYQRFIAAGAVGGVYGVAGAIARDFLVDKILGGGGSSSGGGIYG